MDGPSGCRRSKDATSTATSETAASSAAGCTSFGKRPSRRSAAASVDPEAVFLLHLRPLVLLGREPRAGFARGLRLGTRAERSHLLGDVGQRDDALHLVVQPADRVGRQLRGRDDALPGAGAV